MGVIFQRMSFLRKQESSLFVMCYAEFISASEYIFLDK